jgi:ABC-type nitrate/sulfonate/bicarbonate transport system permease component
VSRHLAFLKSHAIGIATVLALIVGWEFAAFASPKTVLAQTPLVPTFENIFGPSLLGMADYWKFPFWAPITSLGGEQSYTGAFLALGWHSALTLSRLVAGVILGTVSGIGLGLLLSWSPLVRRSAYLPLGVIRMVPLLAMIPLFQFWVGTNAAGVIAFVAMTSGAVLLVGTVNAVSNVPARYVDYARALGAGRTQTYIRVVIPAILPELMSSALLVLGLSWSAVIAGEYVGIDSGLGRILTFAQFMSQTGRMALVALIVLAFVGVGNVLAGRIGRRMLDWMPNDQHG